MSVWGLGFGIWDLGFGILKAVQQLATSPFLFVGGVCVCVCGFGLGHTWVIVFILVGLGWWCALFVDFGSIG